MAGLEQLQGWMSDQRRVQSEQTLITRQIAIPTPCVTGTTGDDDQRRLGYGAKELANSILVQRGVNGLRSGAITTNLEPKIFLPGAAILESHTSISAWGQTRIDGGQEPFMAADFTSSGGSGPPTDPNFLTRCFVVNATDTNPPCPDGAIPWP